MRKLLIVLAIVCMGNVCFADTTIIQKVESGAIMGQPGTNTIQTMRIKGTKARIDHQDKSEYQIIDLGAKKVYLVNPDKKEAIVMSLDMMDAAGAMLKQMNQNPQMNIQNTGNTRTVNGFKCTDYLVSITGGISLNSKQCVTTDVDFSDFEAFRPYAEGMLKMFMGEKGTAELPPGLTVVSESEMSMMGQKITSKTELQSVKKEQIPASMLEVPQGFQVKEMPGMPKK